MRYLLLICALAAGGCILPVSTGAPMPATTVGQGKVGFAMSGEAPVLDLIAENDDGTVDSTSAISYGAAPAAAMTLSLSYGISDDTDLEIAGEGALYYFILPLPTGGSIGLRHHLASTGDFDIALAARFGGVTSSSSSTDTNGNTSEYGASAAYGAFQGIIQYKQGTVRPLVALNLMPARIKRNFTDEPDYEYHGMATSLTFGLMFVSRSAMAGPYITGTNFYSDRFDNVGWFASGGIMIALRPDRNRKPPPPQPQPYYEPVPPPYTPSPPPYQAPPPPPYPPPVDPSVPPPTDPSSAPVTP